MLLLIVSFQNQSPPKTYSYKMAIIVSTSMAKYVPTSLQPVESSHSILSENE